MRSGVFKSLIAIALSLLALVVLGWIGRGNPILNSLETHADGPVTRTLFLPLVARNYEPPVPTIFGVQMYGALNKPSAGLTLTQEARVYWVRWPLAWSAVEPVDTIPANYNFSTADASIISATQSGLHLIVTIVGNPSWAATYANGPIDKADIGEFAEFVGAVVERYDGDGFEDAPGSPVVEYWEFYNEPDGGNRLRAEYGDGYWGHFGSNYAQMLCAVYPVIKAANPQAKVALGGLAYDWFEDQGGPFVRAFLDDVLSAGGGKCIDVMNFHYYPAFQGVWADYGPGLSGKANFLRNKLAQYGVDKPMICTETGWFSGGHSTPSTPETQAAYVPKLFIQSMYSQLGINIWFSWIDPGHIGEWGLLTTDLRRKPAFYAYQTAARKLGRALFQRPLSPQELSAPLEVEGYLLHRPDGKALYVLWSNDDITRTVSLPLTYARVTNMYGDTIDNRTDGDDGTIDGRIWVSVGFYPLYVEESP